MSDDADKSLTLEIKTKADLAAAKAARAELEAMIDRAKFMGKDYADMEVQLRKVDGSLQDYAKTTGHVDEEVEKLEYSHHELRSAMSVLGPESQELSEIMIGSMEGPIGIMVAATAIVKLLTEAFNEAQEKAKVLREQMAELTTDTWTAQRDAANAASEAASSYANQLDRISTAHDNLAGKEQAELAVLQAKQQALEAILKAQEAAEIAAAGGDKIKEAEIKNRYGAKTSQSALAAEKQTIETEQGQADTRNQDDFGLKQKADVDEYEYEEALRNAQAAKDNPKLNQLIAGQGDLDKKAGEFDLDALREKLKTASTVTGEIGQSDHAEIQDQIDAGEKAAKAAEDNRTKVNALNAVGEQHKEAVEKAKAAADESSNALKENAAAIRALDDKIKEATAIYDIHKTTAATVKGIEAPATQFGHGLTAEKGDALKVVNGQADQVSQESQALMLNVGALLAGHAISLAQAAKLITEANANNANFSRSVDAMNHTGDAMAKFSTATAAKLEGFERDIELAFARISDLRNK